MKNRFFSLVIATTALAVSLSSCYKDESLVITGVALNGCVGNMSVGTDYNLSVKIDTGIDQASQYHWFSKPDKKDVNTNVRWESDDTDVATVDQNGKVTPVGAGSTNINVILVETDMILEQCYVTVTE